MPQYFRIPKYTWRVVGNVHSSVGVVWEWYVCVVGRCVRVYVGKGGGGLHRMNILQRS